MSQRHYFSSFTATLNCFPHAQGRTHKHTHTRTHTRTHTNTQKVQLRQIHREKRSHGCTAVRVHRTNVPPLMSMAVAQTVRKKGRNTSEVGR